jgi:hypothetical protein
MTQNEIVKMNEDLKIVFQAFKDIRKVLIKWNIGIEDALLIFRLKSFNAKWIGFRYAPIILKRLLTIKDRFDFTPVQKRVLYDAIEFHNPQKREVKSIAIEIPIQKKKGAIKRLFSSFN